MVKQITGENINLRPIGLESSRLGFNKFSETKASIINRTAGKGNMKPSTAEKLTGGKLSHPSFHNVSRDAHLTKRNVIPISSFDKQFLSFNSGRSTMGTDKTRQSRVKQGKNIISLDTMFNRL